MSCQQVNIQLFLISRCFPCLLLVKISVQNVAEQSTKDSSLCLCIIFFKTKTEQNKPHHLGFLLWAFPFPWPLPAHRSILQYQPERGVLKVTATATSQDSHQRHSQQRQGKSQLAARPAAGDRGYKSEGEMTHERPKFDGIRAGRKNLDWPFLARKPDILLTLVPTGKFKRKCSPARKYL